MKIIYILSSSGVFDGSSKSFLFMLEGLINKKVNTYVVLPERGALCENLDAFNVPYYIIPYSMHIYPPSITFRNKLAFIPRLLKLLYENFKATNKLITYINQIKPDIIHSNVGPIQIGYNAAKRLGIPHVWHVREYQDLDFEMHPIPTINSFKDKLHHSNNYSIAITRGLYDYFSLNQMKARVIYNPVLNALDARLVLEKDKYFLYAGRIQKNKGIKNLITAFSEFCVYNVDYKLFVAGDTSDLNYKNYILSIVDENHLNDKVIFLGMRNDIYDLMAKATALIVPSANEGFGRITAEAMFNGCLVIGNNAGGTKEILEAENLGLLYSGNEQLTNMMRRVVKNGIESYFPIIKKAQELAISRYSQTQNIEAVYKLYKEILKANKNC